MTDYQTWLHGVFATQYVKIGTADRRQRDANNRFTRSGFRSFNSFDSNVVHAVKDVGSHCVCHGKLLLTFMVNFLSEQFLKQINCSMDISRHSNMNGPGLMTAAGHAMNEAAHHLGAMPNHGIESGGGFVQNGQVREQIAPGFARSSKLSAPPVRSRRARWTIGTNSRPRQALDIR